LHAGLPSSLVYTPTKSFASRFGFAWRPKGGVPTVVRGGYGIFYGGNMWNQIRKDMGDVYPFTAEEGYSKSSKQPLNLTLHNPLGVSSKLDGVLTPNGFNCIRPPRYLQSWNLTVEREIGHATAVEALRARILLPAELRLQQIHRRCFADQRQRRRRFHRAGRTQSETRAGPLGLGSRP
jgi:hypothetical protein